MLLKSFILGLGTLLLGIGIQAMNLPLPGQYIIYAGCGLIAFVAIHEVYRKVLKKITSTVKTPKPRPPKSLPEVQTNILKFLATLSSNERLHTDEIAEYLRLSPQETQLLLDQIEQVGLVDKSGDSYVSDLFPTKYSLNEGGRIYLNNKGLL